MVWKWHHVLFIYCLIGVYLFYHRHTDASHFWLNEGWTTYIERVLQQVLHSPAHRGLSYLIGYKSLQDALRQFESTPKYQRLIIDFEFGEDPDDAYSKIPYEKGSNFLLHLGTSILAFKKNMDTNSFRTIAWWS